MSRVGNLMKNSIVRIIISFFIFSIFIIGNYDAVSAAKVSTYWESPHNLTKFTKKGKYLIIKSKYRFSKGNKRSKKKVLKYKIAKKCKWRFKNNGNRFPEAKGISKFKYKDMRKTIYEDMDLPDNGYHTLTIKVKNKKIISVTYECI